MTDFPEVTYLKERVRSESAGLRYRLKEYVAEFPAGTPLKLIEITEGLLKELDDGLTTLNDVNQIKSRFHVLGSMSSLLTLLDNAHSQQTPRGLVHVLQRAVNELFPSALLLVAPTADYTYTITDLIPGLKRLAQGPLDPEAFRRFEATLPSAMYVVQFPRISRENVLNHVVFGHEFGHPIAEEFLRKHEATQAFKDRFSAIQKEMLESKAIQDGLAKRESATDKTKYRNQVLQMLDEIHERAFEELLSDAVAVELFGPSAVFALVDILVQDELDNPPSAPLFYPPNRSRMRWVYERLAANGHVDALRSLKLDAPLAPIQQSLNATLDYIERLIKDQSDIEALHKRSPVISGAYNLVKDTLSAAMPVVQERTKKLVYSPALMAEQVPGLLERLSLQVPPNELGLGVDAKFVDSRSSFLASWLHVLNDTIRPLADPVDQQRKLLTTQNLALKGVELALLQDDYQKFCAEEGLG
jgi:hypothetical protein